MSTTTRAPKLFPIPSGAVPSTCRACPEQIYFVAQPSGAMMPLEVRGDVPGSLHPSASHDGMGTAHWITCPGAAQFRRRA